ncbi:serine protease inhibitor 88Ea-like [Phymastichus coffea]|uniref:serine protease inhibitor 88Ea-like n=1 Tax=Phymastichus coffea TaxID=108790 RepID=UPI00273C03BC|nr:serine protease inhibitor 88Ea-like [Phymastichus coffea]
MTSSIPMLALLVLVGLVAGIQGQCLTANDNPTTMRQDAAQKLSDARFDFALQALKKIAEIETQDNIFFSPHSLHEALALAYFGAAGSTEAALKKALHVPADFSKIDVQRFYAFEKSVEAERKMNSSSNYDFQVANRLWLSSSKKLRECMLDLFGNELERVNFSADPDAARRQINNWVSNVTRNNINDLLPEGAIDASTDALLANAVYFKGLWQSKFLPENTKRDVFYLGPDNMTIAQFMRQKGSFNHMVSEELGVHILQLPYKGDDVSMYILLPPFVSTLSAARAAGQPKNDGVRQLLHRLSDNTDSAKEFRDFLDTGLPARDVELSIPKFSLERELPVKDLLREMGAEVVFDTNADFSGFVADGESTVHLGDALHRAKIEVTEEGTTAAAATALFSFRSSRPTEPAVFTANHPFAYFIYERPSRTVLFAGVFRRPNKR